MNTVKLMAIVLIVVGLLGASYGGFSYTKETHEANIGPLHLQVVEKERVNIPLWLGLGVAVAGAVLLVAGSRKS
jgi:drug/metabolite transporter (DMT)-like permease